MNKFLAVCLVVLSAGFASQTSAQEKQALRLVQTIPLPGVIGRLDHMGVDLGQKRLFVAAVDNNTLEVVDLTGGKVIKSLAGFKDTQDAVFLGGDFNKLYVSSLDGHVRVLNMRPGNITKASKTSGDTRKAIATVRRPPQSTSP